MTNLLNRHFQTALDAMVRERTDAMANALVVAAHYHLRSEELDQCRACGSMNTVYESPYVVCRACGHSCCKVFTCHGEHPFEQARRRPHAHGACTCPSYAEGVLDERCPFHTSPRFA